MTTAGHETFMGEILQVTPGPCPHRPKNLQAVIGADGTHLAWLCSACSTQLPATFAVLADDL